jgi:hypothetical protein
MTCCVAGEGLACTSRTSTSRMQPEQSVPALTSVAAYCRIPAEAVFRTASDIVGAWLRRLELGSRRTWTSGCMARPPLSRAARDSVRVRHPAARCHSLSTCLRSNHAEAAHKQIQVLQADDLNIGSDVWIGRTVHSRQGSIRLSRLDRDRGGPSVHPRGWRLLIEGDARVRLNRQSGSEHGTHCVGDQCRRRQYCCPRQQPAAW